MSDIFDTINLEKPKSDVFSGISTEPKQDIFDEIAPDEPRERLTQESLQGLSVEEILALEKPLVAEAGQFLRSIDAIEPPEIVEQRKAKKLEAKRAEVAKRPTTALQEAEKSLTRGQLNVQAGLGGTLEEFARLAETQAGISKPILSQIGKIGAEFARQARIDLKDPELTKADLKDKSPLEKAGLFVAQIVPETMSFMLGTTVSTVIGGPAAGGVFAFSVEGESAFQRALERGATKAEANIDRMVVGTINAVIELYQAKSVLKFGEKGLQSLKNLATKKTFAALKQAGKEVSLAGLKQFITEGLQEATQEAVGIATPAVREGELPDIEQAIKEIGAAGLAGGVSGLFLGGGAAFGQAITEEPTGQPPTVQPIAPVPTPVAKPPVEGVVAPKPPTAPIKPQAVKPAKPRIRVEAKLEVRPLEQTTTEKTPEIQTKVAETVETDFTKATSAKQASLAEDRKSMGLDEINSKSRRSWETALKQAKTEKIASKANRIAEEVNATPRALSDVETAGVTIRMAELKNEHKEAMETMSKSKDDADIKTKSAEINRIEAEFDALTKAVNTSGTEKGRALAAQKLTINKDFSLISVLNRAKAAAGKKLTAVQNQIFKGLTQRLDKTTKRVETLEIEVNELKARGFVRRGVSRFGTMTVTQRATNLDSLVERTNLLLQEGCNN